MEFIHEPYQPGETIATASATLDELMIKCSGDAHSQLLETPVSLPESDALEADFKEMEF